LYSLFMPKQKGIEKNHLELPERINPDTGVKFQMYDERPKNPKEDGTYYPQDGRI